MIQLWLSIDHVISYSYIATSYRKLLVLAIAIRINVGMELNFTVSYWQNHNIKICKLVFTKCKSGYNHCCNGRFCKVKIRQLLHVV